VPVLVQASDDDLDKLDTLHRRDSFCGKLSVCNNLYQYGIPFTDAGTHTVAIDSPAFTRDIEFFAGVCRVVGGLQNARIGAIGTRPAAFQTMRASEKLLQAAGITVIPVDLSEIIAATNKVDIKSSRARRTLERIKAYGRVPAGISDLDAKFERHLRLFLAVQDWMDANAIDAAGFQCWTSLQQNYGCAACLTMSMMSDGPARAPNRDASRLGTLPHRRSFAGGSPLRPCACEVDVAGVTAMYALVLASGNAAAIVDWNNN
jgi:L-fucose isomerase-like protein